MAIKLKHHDCYSMYFVTFTCYKWMNLFEKTNSYDLVYKWFDYLKTKNIHPVAFVIMPNHLHVIIYFPEAGFDLNKIIGNAKRIMAYEIVNRLKLLNATGVLAQLSGSLTSRERAKGQLHKVFEGSFDAKAIWSEDFFQQKLQYIHFNPVRGKWLLAADFTAYVHSSAAYYETGHTTGYVPFDYRYM